MPNSLVLLKIFGDENQFTHLGLQVYPEDSTSLHRAYLDATQQSHGYLLLDLLQDSNNRLLFRSNIFLSEYPPVIYAAEVVDVDMNNSE
jgi:hypothetical protein